MLFLFFFLSSRRGLCALVDTGLCNRRGLCELVKRMPGTVIGQTNKIISGRLDKGTLEFVEPHLNI